MATPATLPRKKVIIALSVRDLGHNHSKQEILPVGRCPRCDWVRGRVALDTRFTDE